MQALNKKERHEMRERVRREELYERESKWRDKSESERKQKVKKNKI